MGSLYRFMQKLWQYLSNGDKTQLKSCNWKCVFNERCYATTTTKNFSHHVKLFQEAGQRMFYILAGSFQFQQLRPPSLLLIEGDVGVLWELCWKGNPLVRGSSHARGISGRWESTITQRNQGSETSEWPAQFLMNYAMKLWCPREPVPNDKHIMCPPVCKIKSHLLVRKHIAYCLCCYFSSSYLKKKRKKM